VPIESTAVESPGWWLKKLKKNLDARQTDLRKYNDYYTGKHPLKFASPKFRQAFGGLFDAFADNWTELVVNAVEERLNVEGFRLGKETKGDSKAWDIWQANGLDSQSQVAHLEALIHGESYVLVDPFTEGIPVLTIEHPTQTIVAYAAGSRTKRVAALKCWEEEDGQKMATLYLPNEIWKFKAPKHASSFGSWTFREVEDEDSPLPNPLGAVPVVPLVNRQRWAPGGESEIKQVIPLQDAVNKLVADTLTSSEFAAFMQKWATGLEIPVDPETKQPIEPFKAAVDRIWAVASPDTKFGEFSATELQNFVVAIEMLVQHIASQTRTPPHYFYLKGNFPSGEAIKSAETGLVAKAKRKTTAFGEAWEEVIRLAFTASGDRRRALIMSTETIWGDPESRSESELADAVMKRRALGVPLQQCWEDLGYSQVQIDRFKDMLAQENELGVTIPTVSGSPLPEEQEPELQPAAL
jgi:hypothetical protein